MNENQNKFDNWEHSSHKINYLERETNPWIVIGQVLTIVSSIMWCLTIIGLIWGIPMIIGCSKRLNKIKQVTIIHIIISILFFGFICGILTLVGATQRHYI